MGSITASEHGSLHRMRHELNIQRESLIVTDPPFTSTITSSYHSIQFLSEGEKVADVQPEPLRSTK